VPLLTLHGADRTTAASAPAVPVAAAHAPATK